jgi:two-component system NarL family sensor kinase
MFHFFKSKSADAAASRQAMEACEHIISEMGAELHDDLIQKLSVFRLYIDQLDRSRFNAAETETLLIKMNADFKEVVQSVRRISRQLLPVKMEGDSFQTGINILCQNMERPGGSTIHFSAVGTERKIPALAEIYLSRMVQELIHNSLKHSSAWHIWVRLEWQEHRLSLEVEDDGTGFSKVSEFIESLKKKHNTLRMRSEAIGAHISFMPGKKGLLVKVEYEYDTKID